MSVAVNCAILSFAVTGENETNRARHDKRASETNRVDRMSTSKIPSALFSQKPTRVNSFKSAVQHRIQQAARTSDTRHRSLHAGALYASYATRTPCEHANGGVGRYR